VLGVQGFGSGVGLKSRDFAGARFPLICEPVLFALLFHSSFKIISMSCSQLFESGGEVRWLIKS